MRHTYLWLAQLATGVIILILIGIHVVAQHPNGIMMIMQWFNASAMKSAFSTWASNARQNFWTGLYAAIIVLGLFHGANGLRGIIIEMSPSSHTKRLVTWTIVGTGAVFAGVVVVALLRTAKA